MTTSQVKRRRGRPKSTESKELNESVLLASLKHFAQKGFEGTSVREICAEVGVSHNMINDRFGNKDALWRATLDHWISAISKEVNEVIFEAEPGTAPVEIFRALAIRFLEANAQRPEVLRIMNIESAVESERIEYLWNTHIRRFYQLFSKYYRAARASKDMYSYPPTTLFFLLAHGGAAAAASPALCKRLLAEDTKGAKRRGPEEADALDFVQTHRSAEFIADLLIGSP